MPCNVTYPHHLSRFSNGTNLCHESALIRPNTACRPCAGRQGGLQRSALRPPYKTQGRRLSPGPPAERWVHGCAHTVSHDLTAYICTLGMIWMHCIFLRSELLPGGTCAQSVSPGPGCWAGFYGSHTIARNRGSPKAKKQTRLAQLRVPNKTRRKHNVPSSWSVAWEAAGPSTGCRAGYVGALRRPAGPGHYVDSTYCHLLLRVSPAALRSGYHHPTLNRSMHATTRCQAEWWRCTSRPHRKHPKNQPPAGLLHGSSCRFYIYTCVYFRRATGFYFYF